MSKADYSKNIYPTYNSSAIYLISCFEKVKQISKRKIPIPEVVEIFPTNYCNFSCPHCRCAEYHGSKNEYMPIKVFESLLKELSSKGVNSLEISGGGEPLMHPQAEEMFELIKKYNFRIGMITNGYPLVGNKKLQNLIIECSDWVRFSLDAFSEETFCKVHGKKDISYKELTKTIKSMARTIKKGLPRIELKMLISKLNYKDCEKGLKEAKRMGVNQLHYKYLANSPIALGKKEIQKTFKKLSKQKEEAEKKGIILALSPGYGGKNLFEEKCLMTFLHPLIDWDGTIYLCAFFSHRKKEHSLGNINKNGFFKNWFSKTHWKKFDSINSKTCVPNCPMKRYNPIVNYIQEENYHFKYI
ncbi:MAG: radical SAM protein [archaeon]|jgi:radical SAM protein with 4Fe4S-binding SPASM domain